MITFTSRTDLNKLPRSHPAHPLITELFNQICPECGYLVLIELGDIERVLLLPELRGRLVDIPWEGATKHGHYFHAVHLTNNQFGIGFLIPDSVTGELRSFLEELTAG